MTAAQLSLFDACPQTDATSLPCVTAEPAEVRSPCGKYRYRLSLVWQPMVTPVVFVQLHPSSDQRVLPRCAEFARDWGAGGVIIVPLFAFQASDSSKFVSAAQMGVNVIGPETNTHLAAVFGSASEIVCAWGTSKHDFVDNRVHEVFEMLDPARQRVSCLGRSKDQYPRNPIHVARSTSREPYDLSHDSWPSTGITSAGQWGSHDGLLWEKTDRLVVGGRDGFRMGYIVQYPPEARGAMREGMRTATSKRASVRGRP